MSVNPKFDNGNVIEGEVISGGKGMHGKKNGGRTLKGDIHSVMESAKKHPRVTSLVAAGAIALGVNVVNHNTAPDSPIVCVEPNTSVKGTDFGGTVSGLAASQLNAAVKKGRDAGALSPAAIPNFDAALLGLTENTAADIGTRNLASDGTYAMSQQTCVIQDPLTRHISVTSPEMEGK